jgi:hypothetical protein
MGQICARSNPRWLFLTFQDVREDGVRSQRGRFNDGSSFEGEIGPPSPGSPSRSSRFGVSSRERRLVDLTGIEPVTS